MSKLFKKINVIDFAVIVLVIIAVVGISARFMTPAAKNARKTVNISYTVKVENIRSFSIDYLKKKGSVIDGGKIIGEISNVECDSYKNQQLDENGVAFWVSVPERYTAFVTVDAECKETDDGYFVGEGTELAVGSTVSLQTKYLKTYGRITDIKVN